MSIHGFPGTCIAPNASKCWSRSWPATESTRRVGSLIAMSRKPGTIFGKPSMPSSNAISPAVKFYRLAVVVGTVAIIVTLLAYGLWPRQITAQILPDQSIAVDESVRRYRLVIPHSLSADKVPIVFAFHGIGDSPEGMAEYSALDQVAVENGFLLVYPAARRAMWTTVNVDAQNLDDNPDIRFFDRLLEHLAGRYQIDPNRVYMVGMSNGATFAQLVAFARPDIAAVAAHSGPVPRELLPAARQFPIIILVGTNDTAENAMQSDAAEYRDKEHSVEFVAISGLGHEWSIRHNAAIWKFLSGHRLGE